MSKLGKGIDLCLSWVPAKDGDVPEGAVNAGDGSCNVFIARAKHDGDLIPGCMMVGGATIPFGGKAHSHAVYEVLVDSHLASKSPEIKWVHETKGKVPKHAVVGGISAKGEPIYIARTVLDNEIVVGKVHEGHDCGHFPFQGEERISYSYEVITLHC